MPGRFGLVIAVAALGLASSARAQDAGGFAGLMATAVEGVGQSLGEAATSGSSIFVTGKGYARLTAPLTDAYFVNIEGKAASAVDAARIRDQRLDQLRAVSKRFGVDMEIGESAFSREIDLDAQQALIRKRNADRAADRHRPFRPSDDRHHPARSAARLHRQDRRPVQITRCSAPARLPRRPWRRRGRDQLSEGLGARGGMPNLFSAATEVLGFGSVQAVDAAIWDKASADAVNNARHQAEVLAAVSGRQVGEVRQILSLAKGVEGDKASVTIAVRFAFRPKS